MAMRPGFPGSMNVIGDPRRTGGASPAPSAQRPGFPGAVAPQTTGPGVAVPGSLQVSHGDPVNMGSGGQPRPPGMSGTPPWLGQAPRAYTPTQNLQMSDPGGFDPYAGDGIGSVYGVGGGGAPPVDSAKMPGSGGVLQPGGGSGAAYGVPAAQAAAAAAAHRPGPGASVGGYTPPGGSMAPLPDQFGEVGPASMGPASALGGGRARLARLLAQNQR